LTSTASSQCFFSDSDSCRAPRSWVGRTQQNQFRAPVLCRAPRPNSVRAGFQEVQPNGTFDPNQGRPAWRKYEVGLSQINRLGRLQRLHLQVDSFRTPAKTLHLQVHETPFSEKNCGVFAEINDLQIVLSSNRATCKCTNSPSGSAPSQPSTCGSSFLRSTAGLPVYECLSVAPPAGVPRRP